jgi:hypothetical protein
MTALRSFVRRHLFELLKGSPRLKRWYLGRVSPRYGGRQAYVDWRPAIQAANGTWPGAGDRRRGARRVLMATAVGGLEVSTVVESVLAASLTMRGAEVHVLLCDGVLPACFQCNTNEFAHTSRFVRHGPGRDLCKYCYGPGVRTFESLGVTVHRYSDYLDDYARTTARELAAAVPFDAVREYRHDGIPVGEHAMAGALRFYGRATIDALPEAEDVLRRYLEAALLTVFATRRCLERHDFTVAVAHHGLYVPQGLLGDVCRQKGVRAVIWGKMYRKQSFVFSHDDTYHRTLMTERPDVWGDRPWTSDMEAQIVDYLKSRWRGTEDWIRVQENANTDVATVQRELALDPSKPCIGLLTNVMWDAQVCYPTNAFPNMLDWIITTIRYFAARTDLQLLIRVHPGELTRGAVPTRQLVVDEIRKTFPVLPPNVHVIPPDSRISMYAAMAQCNAVLIYATKAGLELAATGMPVIVAGEAWVRNKGFTLDAPTQAAYRELLDRLPLPQRLDAAARQRARQYAYHFFFRRMIPLPLVDVAAERVENIVAASSLGHLLPGNDPGLDVICDGILDNAPFVFPAEHVASGPMQPIVSIEYL